MADNTVLDANTTTGDTIASDDISGVKHQRVKVEYGIDGSATDVSASNPLPVTDALGSTAAKQDAGNVSLASIDGKAPALGQALAAASSPVVLTAAQITTLTPPAAITGFATETTLDARTGSLTETAPATDTASSGLNGRLQRIAQRISSLITALGSPFQAGGSIGNTTFASTVADGSDVTLGAKADAKSSATDTTAITIMSVLKQISASIQAAASSLAGTLTVAAHAVTQSGTWTVQPGNTANTTAWKVDGSAVAQPVTDNSGSLTVDNAGTFAVQSTIAAAATNIAKAEDVASADADVGVPAMMIRKASPANTSGTDGDYEMLQGSAGRLWVDPSGVTLTVGSHAVTNAGTFATQAACTGDVAHDGVDSGNPQKIGAKATTAQSGLTAVSDADRTDLRAGVDGILINRPHTNLEDIVTGNANNTDGSSTQCIAAQSSGIKTYLTSIILTNMSATGIYVEIKDGTTVKVTIPLPANSGAIFNPPVPLPGSAATAWNFDPSAAATTVYCSMIGFKSKV